MSRAVLKDGADDSHLMQYNSGTCACYLVTDVDLLSNAK